jgi:nitroreductase
MNEQIDHHGPTTEAAELTHPNETMRLLLERASLRSFSDEKIPEDVLYSILDAGNHAATGGNLQPYSIIKIEAEENRQWLADRCGQGFIAKAPVNLVFCIDLHRNQRWAELETAPYTAQHSFRHFWISFQDTVIAAQNICTAADAMGLGSVYIGTVMDLFQDIIERLKLPKGVFPVVLLCLGYPKNPPVPRKKLGVDVIVHDETYHEMDDEALLAAFNRKYEHKTYQINTDRLETIEQVSREAHGEEFAQHCIARVKELGYINNVVRYFGLHYIANDMPEGNLDFLKTFEKAGFYWMNEFKKK